MELNDFDEDMDDEDELVYQIKITNLGPSKESVNISGNIKECLKIKSIEYKISDETTILENISNNQKEVEEKLGISQSYISRIEKKVIKRLKSLSK